MLTPRRFPPHLPLPNKFSSLLESTLQECRFSGTFPKRASTASNLAAAALAVPVVYQAAAPQETDLVVQEEALVGQEGSAVAALPASADPEAAALVEHRAEADLDQAVQEGQAAQDIQESLEALVDQAVLEADPRHHPRRTARGPQQRAAGHHEMQDWRTC